MTIGSSCNYGPVTTAVNYGLGRPDQGAGVAKAGQGQGGMAVALAKIQQSDPALAAKLQGFDKQIEDMKANGASKEAIGQTMKANFASLSSREKTEMKAVMGGHHKHHGTPKPVSGGSPGPGVSASAVAPPVQNPSIAQMLLRAKPAVDPVHDGETA